ncbi:MAG: recombinase family protein [Lachnospiraceae bacterium]|nr:recombinase family protein [Lachnospiraceae bacterium]
MDLYSIRKELNSGKSIYDIPMRVTYYARVSTEKDEQLHSLSAQIKYYSDMINGNLNWEFVEGYIDEGLSATSVKKRESFLTMIEDAEAGKFDFIITKEISRFSRNTVDSIQYTQRLLNFGVGVLFQSDNINTLLPDSELRLTIMSSIAQDEVRKISERVRFGFKRAIEKGSVLGNNKIWGYKKDHGKLVILEEEAEIIRKIFDMYVNQHLGMRVISRVLGEQGVKNSKNNDLSASTIRNIISNPKYKGYYCGNKTQKYDYRHSARKYIEPEEWVMYEDKENVPPIVSEELWDRANRILQERGSARKEAAATGAYTNRYKYSGKIICMEHGTSYHHKMYQYKSGTKEAWQCKIYAEKGRKGCGSPILYTTELDEVMRQICGDLIVNQADIIRDLIKIYTEASGASILEQEIAKCRMEIDGLLHKKDKLLDLNIKCRISDEEFEERNNACNVQMEEVQKKIRQLEEDKEKNKNVVDQIHVFPELISKELNFGEGISSGMADAILDRIEVAGKDQRSAAQLNIYLKVLDESMTFFLNRKRGGETSVCAEPYI